MKRLVTSRTAPNPGDWVEEIHKDRAAKEEKARKEAHEARRQLEVFGSKADDFWGQVTAELTQVVDRYNRRADDLRRVEIDTVRAVGVPDMLFRVAWKQARGAEVSLNKTARTLRIMLRPDKASLEYSITATAAGELRADGNTPADIARAALEPFLRSIR